MVSVVSLFILAPLTEVDVGKLAQLLVISFAAAWPIYVAVYVTWSFRVYSRLRSAPLRQATVMDDQDERRPLARILGVTGATDTTIAAAIVAVIITIVIAHQAEFRSEPLYIVAALMTVASSWVLMVFAFAQSYLRLGSGGEREAHFRFHFPGTVRFGDYLNLALMLSASAATVSAEVTSRAAWNVVRTNVVVAFVFNSVIIAMMVSLVFGGVLR